MVQKTLLYFLTKGKQSKRMAMITRFGQAPPTAAAVAKEEVRETEGRKADLTNVDTTDYIAYSSKYIRFNFKSKDVDYIVNINNSFPNYNSLLNDKIKNVVITNNILIILSGVNKYAYNVTNLEGKFNVTAFVNGIPNSTLDLKSLNFSINFTNIDIQIVRK